MRPDALDALIILMFEKPCPYEVFHVGLTAFAIELVIVGDRDYKMLEDFFGGKTAPGIKFIMVRHERSSRRQGILGAVIEGA
jgi:hypothetical protein